MLPYYYCALSWVRYDIKHLTEKLLDDQLIDDDIKKFKQNIETEVCSYSPFAFLHRHRHIV